MYMHAYYACINMDIYASICIITTCINVTIYIVFLAVYVCISACINVKQYIYIIYIICAGVWFNFGGGSQRFPL